MIKPLAALVLLAGLYGCQAAPVKEMGLPCSKPERILADIQKINVPVIEKKSRMVRVTLEGSRPALCYGQEELEINKSETGYEIRLWLIKSAVDASSLSLKKEVAFKIPVSGGHDVEVIGKNRKFIEIVFIDEHD